MNETAFFFPQVTTDSNGVSRFTFTMPEALTTWRVLAFAHDKELRSGMLADKVVTSKEIMVQPNPPRFVREGDTIEFSVKVLNQSTNRQTGRIQLTFRSALDDQSADALLGNRSTELAFDVPAKESKSYAWRLQVPDGAPHLIYKTVASTATLSDGEEGNLPVLPRRIFVTESLPLAVRGTGAKSFELAKLIAAEGSGTIRHESLTVQMVSNPAWYAVLALPYLMNPMSDSTEQTFNQLYANALAKFIANSDPRLRRMFDQWKGTAALDSPLEKSEELKAVSLQETPWLAQAKNESQARRNVGILFDDNRLNYELGQLREVLAQAQLPDGRWPWFAGGRGNDFITLYITTGFGRLRHLGADVPLDSALRSLQRLDVWMQERYDSIQKQPNPGEYVLNSTDALYLYGRSFFLKDRPIAAEQSKAIEFFLAQARKNWVKVGDRLSQGHLALALKRFGPATDPTPMAIVRSLKERSVTNEELGMFWRDTELSWWWYRAPIETQALMIEVFDEVAADQIAVEECRVWLLKQKQTQNWKTSKATADAVYALLLRGRDLLANSRLAGVTVGGIDVTPTAGGTGATSVEPGTGFYERRFPAAEVKPVLGRIVVAKSDAGIAWGGVHWQYFEDVGKVTGHEATPLKLTKSLFTKVNTAAGPQLRPAAGPLQVGDELVVKIELRVDRDMEYVHLKDQRGSGTEPVNVLSQHKYQDGLAYYETTRDTASHFYFDYLPKGTYVFEYSTRIQQRGEYQSGIADIQCLYAPEFNSHSASTPIVVR